MKATVIKEPGYLVNEELPEPEIRNDEVLLKVHYCGFCGGDLNAYRGTFVLQEYPVVLGHEIGAEIVQIGNEVPENYKIGMTVTVYPYQNCGHCVACRKGKPNACLDNKTMGVRRPGAMTQYVAIPWKDVIPTASISSKAAALVEPLAVGFHAVSRANVKQNDIVAVIGCGMVGMGAIASSHANNATVIGIDIDDHKLSIAKKAGAKHIINTNSGPAGEKLDQLTNGNGPDVIIEAVGNEQTYQMAVEKVSSLGRVICIGYAKKPVEFDTSLFVKKEIEIYGSRNAEKNQDFSDVIKVLETGKFPVDEVISKTVSQDDAPAALKEWSESRGKLIKVLVKI